jgi:hypothetical protein
MDQKLKSWLKQHRRLVSKDDVRLILGIPPKSRKPQADIIVDFETKWGVKPDALKIADLLRMEKFLAFKRRRVSDHTSNYQGVPFNVRFKDIAFPKYCPITKVELDYTSHPRGKVPRNAATFDRVINSKGYVKGNVRVVSQHANFMKQNSTVKNLKRIIAYMEGRL